MASKRNDGNNDKHTGILMNHGKEESGVAAAPQEKVLPPRKYNVVFHNDDKTSMNFVGGVLMKFFGYEYQRAKATIWDIHEHGRCVVGSYIKAIAETKAYLVRKAAKKDGYPLKVTTEVKG